MVKAWSFSALENYEECPRQYKYRKIDKLEEPQGAALAKGTLWHKACEFTLKGQKLNEGLAKAFSDFTPTAKEQVAELVANNAAPEVQIALTKNLTVTSWFGQDAWFRAILDAYYVDSNKVAHIKDFKTGQMRKVKQDQKVLSLFAAYRLLAKSGLVPTKFSFQFIPLEMDVVDPPYEVSLSELTASYRAIEERAKAGLLVETKFSPKPGNHCRYCHFRASNNGPCSEG